MTDESLVVFSDLDGTLLDSETYAFDAALPALDRLRAMRIPLVVSTSKTRAEVGPLREALRNHDPFIVENGGGICIPDGYFPFPIDGATHQDGTWVIPVGTGHDKLARALANAAKESGVSVRGFADMSDTDVAAATGLGVREAGLARRREFDEPFQILDPARAPELVAAIERQGYRHTSGGRFHHITGASDKGSAVRRLISLFARHLGRIRTVGLGDAPNDESLLNVVDIPILIDSPRVTELRALVPHGRATTLPGPAGWNAAVLDMLDQFA
jgi:mannosyl-3-phosphoglycerate phosphatase